MTKFDIQRLIISFFADVKDCDDMLNKFSEIAERANKLNVKILEVVNSEGPFDVLFFR
ncbi:MAG TPA: hypothetical protein PLI27_09300 [Ignavibacteriales bacterium]|nr:hypothetical protein [Ignavibacteriales bacterium]HOL80198.1 hypothetical protein [Ignavibacteriales bacterium]HOM64480.1 hypothetical protein [Ignavibacteriales bacterium]HPD68255.1 hypothetical protein [Ignavibacteriales bacterium]HPP32387.1 hypothetical protein [Ignavibacteriales bacterium]